MNLLLGRSQHQGVFSLVPLRIGFGVVFKLRARLELSDEEKALLWKYNLDKAPLVLGSRWAAIRRAMISALIVGAAVYLGLLAYNSWRYGVQYIAYFLIEAAAIPAIVTAIMVVVYYLNERDHIIVKHLLYGGRTFRCDSVVELIHKEAYLERISEYLRQVLESAKHWQNREVIEIKPLDKEAAKQAVLRGA